MSQIRGLDQRIAEGNVGNEQMNTQSGSDLRELWIAAKELRPQALWQLVLFAYENQLDQKSLIEIAEFAIGKGLSSSPNMLLYVSEILMKAGDEPRGEKILKTLVGDEYLPSYCWLASHYLLAPNSVEKKKLALSLLKEARAKGSVRALKMWAVVRFQDASWLMKPLFWFVFLYAQGRDFIVVELLDRPSDRYR